MPPVCFIIYCTCTPTRAHTRAQKQMTDQNHISLFEGKQVRYLWDEEKQQYFFSVVDVIQVLTDSPRPREIPHRRSHHKSRSGVAMWRMSLASSWSMS